MRKIDCAADFNGRPLAQGDVVALLSDHVTAKICDIASDEGETFVRLRPVHQPYGRGVWHAADRVLWMTTARKPKPKGSAPNRALPPKAARNRY